MDQEKLKSSFKTIKKNILEYSDLNDSLYDVSDFDKWNIMLRERSEKIRKIFKENEKAIQVINEELKNDFDEESSECVFQILKELKQEEIHDSGFIIPIMRKLISYYEKEKNFSKLLFLYLNQGYEIMEYYLRMGAFKFKDEVRESFIKAIAIRKYYKRLSKPRRARLFIGYYNLTAVLPDIIPEYEKDILCFYKEFLDFYTDNDLANYEANNEFVAEETAYLVESFCYNFGRFIDPDKKNRKEFFTLVEKSLKIFDNISIDVKRVLRIVLGYYHNKYDKKELFNRLDAMNQEYLDMNLKYDGTEDSILKFCNWSDVTGCLLEILKTMDLPITSKGQYTKRIMAPLLEYISLVSYKDYTSYFDDISSDLFKELLPYMETLEEKVDLIQRLIIRRQPITYIHSLMVRQISIEITKAIFKNNRNLPHPLYYLGMDGADILDYIAIGAMIHDLGKCLTVGVINCQSRSLTKDEFDCIKLHPKRALVFLNGDEDFRLYYDIMVGHHKWYNGLDGYPSDFDNQKSEYKIAIDIISIADSIDAATDILGRNYAKGKDFQTLLKELIKGKGTRYNPEIVDLIANDIELKDKLKYLTEEGREIVYYKAYKEILNK